MRAREVDAILNRFEPRLRDAFKNAIDDIKDRIILTDLINAITEGDLDKAIKLLGVSEQAFSEFNRISEELYEVGGVKTAETFPRRMYNLDGPIVFRFHARNSRSEAYSRDRSSTRITNVKESVKSNVRNIMFEGVKDGRNPRNVALDIVGKYDPIAKKRIGGVLGISEQQKTRRDNMREELNLNSSDYFSRKGRDKRFDSIVQKAIDSGKPLDSDQIDKLVTRYEDNLLKDRGTTIARTEALTALNTAEYEAMLQASEMGATKTIKRIWDSAGPDGRTRDTHLKVDGQERGLKEYFTIATKKGEQRLMFPCDSSLGADASEIINCRCRTRIEIDWLEGID